MEFNLFEGLEDTQKPQKPQRTQDTPAQAYLANTLKAEQCKAEITKGITAGEGPYKLLLKAIECIALMTGEPAYYHINRESLISIHGLLDPEPLQMELEQVQTRLTMLEAAATQEPNSSGIQAAIKAHRTRADRIEETLRTQKASHI
ncbi:MAG: hypothetical protein BWY62_01365 [Firmicutes bacterium ADurb.Bin356]|nr:MAG: hypothetical protein BWY62_01365 [Firmicutes bacterium ADurb.Bin356]